MSPSETPTRRDLADAGERGDEALAADEGAGEEGPDDLGRGAEVGGPAEGPTTASAARLLLQRMASPRRRKISRESGGPVLRVLDGEAHHLLALLLLSLSLTHAVPRRPRPLAMRPRASGVSICPSGVRKKMASGAGRGAEELR